MCITGLFVNNLHQICMWYADGINTFFLLSDCYLASCSVFSVCLLVLYLLAPCRVLFIDYFTVLAQAT